MDKNLRPYLAELIGTFALVFISAGVVCTSNMSKVDTQPQLNLLGIALAQGLILAVALAATIGVSGGFLNPAITLTFWVFKRLDGVKTCWLIGAQLLGAILAGMYLRFMFTEDVLRNSHLGTPHLNMEAFGGTMQATPTLGILASGIAIELALTFLYTFIIYATLLDRRTLTLGGLGPGLALTAMVLMAYNLTGAAVNPARWLGTALWEWTINPRAFVDHPVYWIGPIFGALLAGGIYEFVIWPTTDEVKGSAAPAAQPGGNSGPVTSTLFRAKS